MLPLTRRVLSAAALLAAWSCTLSSDSAAPRDSSRVTAVHPLLRWGGDAEGGAPFVEADPNTPSKQRGFDVEIVALIAQGLGRTPEFVQVAWTSIEQSVARGDFALGMSGIEDRPTLHERFAVSLPYYEFREVLAVRAVDSARAHSLADLRGRRVGTLGGTMAWTMLLAAKARDGIVPVSYDDDVHPYTDLVSGRLDAVLLDHVLAERTLRRLGGFVIQPAALATGHYVAVLAARDSLLRDSVNTTLMARIRDGSLATVFRTWNVWDAQQGQFQRRLLDSAETAPRATPTLARSVAPGVVSPRPRTAQTSAWSAITSYLPALLRAAAVTLLVSVLAMLLAVSAGMVIATGRVYGGRLMRMTLTAYVEVMRGTPVLLQLFVLYYGLSDLVRLPALAAAVLGLGLNYAAYESEIYRAALLAIPRLQLEAARTLGLSEWQILRLVRGPQALRFALAPMTNDFVALLKDSSLVSVITVVELTKQTAIYATNAGSWAVPGALCAVVYLAMSLPLSHMARRLEQRWSPT